MTITPQALLAQAQALLPEMTALRREIHRHPELGRQETHTADLIRKTLSQLGLEVTPCADTGTVAVLRGAFPGKTIGLRADIDALPIQEQTGLPFASETPGVMHACGHDLHTAALLGAAKLLLAQKDTLHGCVKFFFQPDEEQDGGAARMVAAGCLTNPAVDAVFGGHNSTGLPAGEYGIKYGKCYAASNTFTITVHGAACHGAYPASGIDAVCVGSQIVTALQTLVSRRIYATDSAVVTVASFHAGKAKNVIAEEAVLQGIIRTLGPEMRKKMCDMVRQLAEGVAASMGARAQVDIVESYPGVVNEDGMSDLVCRSMAKLVGNDKIQHQQEPNMGTEDFGAFMAGIPGCYCDFGFGDGRRECCHPAHSGLYRANEDGLAYAAALHAQVALDFLEND